MSDKTRRDFLKQTSTTALAAGILGGLQSGAFAAGSDTIRVGLVGCGGRGSGAARQALSTEGNVQLVAVGDAFVESVDASLTALKKAFETKPERVAVDDDHKFVGLDAYRKVIDSDVDLVILATPPGFRPTHFEYAVEKGRHVFMEKPVAVDAPGVRQVLAAAQKAKAQQLKVGVGLQRRHQNCYLDIVPRIHDGAIGDITALRVYWNSGGVWEPRRARDQVRSELEYQVWSWYYYNWLSGDHICEQHIHNLDVGLWLKQQLPVKARGMGGREVRADKRYGEIFDHHAVEYFFADGTVMSSTCSHMANCYSDVSEHAIGTKGTVDLNSNSSPKDNRITPFSGEAFVYRGENPDPYQVEHDTLFAAIRNGETYDEAESGALSTMASVLGRMCTYSGKEISWDEALNHGARVTPDNMADLAWDSAPPTVPDVDGAYPVPVPGLTRVLA
ncbi:MAG: Gfo/Idh/MocA family oxidoreductase [Planctomycetaceae bacterium]|nr:Gfo/Idh/MocA family oxidoreductase [Planctomycetaceae bacterium]